MPRLHKSSWVVAVLAFVVCVLLILPGQHGRSYYEDPLTLSHGWPTEFLTRDVDDPEPVAPTTSGIVQDCPNVPRKARPAEIPALSMNGWRLWHANEHHWKPVNLVIDAGAALAIIVLPTAVWEFRRRRRGNLFQLRLSDFFVATALIAIGLHWALGHWKGYAEQSVHYSILDDLPYDDSYSVELQFMTNAPGWLIRFTGPENIPDCFHRVNHVSIYAEEEANLEHLERIVPRLSHFQYLQFVYIDAPSVKDARRLREAVRAALPDCEIEAYPEQ